MPGVGVTGGGSIGVVTTAVNGEVEGDGAVAAYGVESGKLSIESGCGVGAVMPGVFVTGGYFLDAGGTGVEGQV